MKVYKSQDMVGGWFIGNFKPSVLKTDLFEVSFKKHKKGEIWDIHYHKIATEYNYLINGRMRVLGKDLFSGDIFVINPFEIVDPTFVEDCEIITVKTPSAVGDKYCIPRNKSIKKIAHRGNFNGKNEHLENTVKYIEKALSLGYLVEVDVWCVENKFYLGHDAPNYEVSINYLKNEKLICHAKNLQALMQLSKIDNVHYFWHENDDFTITSEGWLWKYPEVYLDGEIYGLCSDNLIGILDEN